MVQLVGLVAEFAGRIPYYTNGKECRQASLEDTMEQNDTKTFDQEYVKELRSEAAGYRTQLRELQREVSSYKHLEGEIAQLKVENELVKRGVNAEASWIKVGQDQTVAEAVDKFLEKYPQFLPQAPMSDELTPNPQRVEIPNTIAPPAGNANRSDKPRMHKVFGDRSISDIENDAVARRDLSIIYQSLLPGGNPEQI